MNPARATFQRASVTMLGSIIGAGVFGLPALFSQSGFWPATTLFFFLSLATLGMHLLFVKVTFFFPQRHRLAGYARKVGPIGGWIATIAYPLFCVGVSFAYLILGGEFLTIIGQHLGLSWGVFTWQILFWLMIGLVILFGLKFVAKVESVGTWLLITSMLLIIAFSLSKIDVARLSVSSWDHFLIPFGVFLFSLSGISMVGEVVDLARPSRSTAYGAVALGTVLAAFLSWLFGASLYLVRGSSTWEPIQLMQTLSAGWGWLIPVFGFLAIATSYVMMAQDLKETLHLDFRLSKKIAWALALFVPFSLLLFLPREFLSTVDFVGALFGGLNGILVGWMAWRLMRGSKIHWLWRLMAPALVALAFSVGIFYKLFYHPLI